MNIRTAFLVLSIASVCFTACLGTRTAQVTNHAQHWVDSVYASLTPQQRIAQLMIIRESKLENGQLHIYKEKLLADIEKYNIGGICLFQGEPEEQAAVIHTLQQSAQTPLMVCIDGEMGLGMRMKTVQKLPYNITLGAMPYRPALLYNIGKTMALQCQRMGIHVNYAPVVDINNNALNPVIGYRSFGENKQTVAQYATQIIKGMQAHKVMACAKHFPGHGDVTSDSHHELPIINKSLKEIQSTELYPFQQVIQQGVQSIMVGHLFIPSLDSTTNRASSLPPRIVQQLLKKDMQFKGLVFTDALEMKGVADYFPQGDIAAQSLIAGNDMLCLPENMETAIQKIEEAIEKKQLSWQDIEAKTKKVLLAKYQLGIHQQRPIDTTQLTKELNQHVPQIRKQVAEQAITTVRLSSNTVLPLNTKDSVLLIEIGAKEKYTQLAHQLFSNNIAVTAVGMPLNNNSFKTAEELIKEKQYNKLVVALYGYNLHPKNNFGIDSSTIDFIHKAVTEAPESIFINLGNPYVLKHFCHFPSIICAYEDDDTFQESLAQKLLGKQDTYGKLPVTVCPSLPAGTGHSIQQKPHQ